MKNFFLVRWFKVLASWVDKEMNNAMSVTGIGIDEKTSVPEGFLRDIEKPFIVKGGQNVWTWEI